DAIAAEEAVDRGAGADRARPKQLSARALERQSRQVALGLAAAGAEPDAPVVLLAERDLEFWVVMLGILRAGSAYVPIDPSLPAQRIAQVLDECGAAIVVTRPQHDALLDEVASMRGGPPMTQLL